MSKPVAPQASAPFDITQWMTAEVRAAYGRLVRVKRFAAGAVIYIRGDEAREMYRIVSGSVRLYASGGDGREVVFRWFESGDTFGEASLIDDEPRPQTAEAVVESALEVLDAAAFDQLRRNHRDFDEALLRLLSRQMRFANTLVVDLSLGDLAGRIARRILEAVSVRAAQDQARSTFDCAISQAELAPMVGASRQTVNRTLQQMQASGIITTEYNRITVQDLPGLRAMAAST